MKLSVNIDEKTAEVNFGSLTFDSGKKIILDKGEVEEVRARLKLAKAEGKLCATDSLEPIAHDKEFFVTGAYVKGVKFGTKSLLVVTSIDSDTFCDGAECNDRVEKEYGL